MSWRTECKQHRETLACIAEALGWEDVRQPNGDLYLPSREDLLAALAKRKEYINTNDRVWVKLSAIGKDVYSKYCCDKGREPNEVEGWKEWTFWVLMKNVMGKATAGGGVMFEKGRVYFEKPDVPPEPPVLRLVESGEEMHASQEK